MLENSSILAYGARRVKIDTIYHQSKANEARIKESNLDNRKVGKFLRRKRSYLSNTFKHVSHDLISPERFAEEIETIPLSLDCM
jgi:hypothetical protein